ncbi:MAG: DUF47 domain-containing protein [Saprospiraceae bacterium]|nr:DUF47 domain-containing protein [Saprospiraceae bacterium]
MQLNSIFQFFVPKDKKFFPLFEQASGNLVMMGTLLVKYVNTPDAASRESLRLEIEDLEHKGDDITHQIAMELSKNFITPFDREDIHYLANTIDDIADYIHGTANRINFYGIKKITPPIIALADLILEGCENVDRGMKALKNMANVDQIMDACARINDVEDRADEVFDKAVADLFEHEQDAKELIKYKEVLQNMETATDSCKDAAAALEAIAVKNA